ncbi:hypothetical protein CEXT_507611 [Caerostris extrusa]|uniref:Uncharacterized protein n=1 Tax=Caerostris extrusa TaxID=172846 RepID=A0AAV4PCC5_CAEEX|nr:hypothetical protein CEXT_507611 [Caerostris extrusa]
MNLLFFSPLATSFSASEEPFTESRLGLQQIDCQVKTNDQLHPSRVAYAFPQLERGFRSAVVLIHAVATKNSSSLLINGDSLFS